MGRKNIINTYTNDIKDKYFIFSSDKLLIQNNTKIIATILHEIGHIILGHKNSINSIRLTKAQIRDQECQADLLTELFSS